MEIKNIINIFVGYYLFEMMNWFIKYRVEFPLIISVIATAMYAISAPLFLIYSPERSLLLSLVVTAMGASLSLLLVHPQLSRQIEPLAPLKPYAIFISDFSIWFGFALFTGVWWLLPLTIVLFLVKYLRNIIAISKLDKQTTLPMLTNRVMNTLLLYTVSLIYMSAMKSYLILDTFSVQSSVVIVVLTYIAVYIVARNRKFNRMQETNNEQNT